ncbi:MAG: YetF domain-containing protein [Flavipsychrobacter sp.]
MNQQSTIYRLLFGEAPIEFLVETFFRTLLIYIILLIIVRWLGKRMAGQLTITEMAIMLMLGAIVAPAMQMPDKGVIATIFVLIAALLVQRGLNWLNVKSARLEHITQGEIGLIAADGLVLFEELKKSRITHQQLYQVLRSKDIYNLGEVEAVYLEACGLFSIYKFEQPQSGLPLFPPDDKDILPNDNLDDKLMACTNCGFVADDNNSPCSNCGADNWTKAIKAG